MNLLQIILLIVVAAAALIVIAAGCMAHDEPLHVIEPEDLKEQ